jgi:hypothetical protein
MFDTYMFCVPTPTKVDLPGSPELLRSNSKDSERTSVLVGFWILMLPAKFFYPWICATVIATGGDHRLGRRWRVSCFITGSRRRNLAGQATLEDSTQLGELFFRA